MNKLILGSLISFLFVGSSANADDYKPTDPVFWEAAQSALKDTNYGKVLKLADEKMRKTKKDSLEYAEAMLAVGKALSKTGFSFGSTGIFGEIIKNKLGTQVATEALNELEDIVRHHSVDEDYVYGEILNDLEFDQLPQNLQDFVNFEQGLYNLLKGYDKWSDEAFKKITVDSYWDYKLKYLTALGEVARDRMDSALERFSGISSSQQAPDDIKTDATHQYARIVFEKGDYPQAYKILKGVVLNPREKGLILLERAWAKYYQKDYSKALGLLAALESPVFDTSRSPEPYILRMIMYKELCYYDAAFEVVQEFNMRFGPSLKAIKQRRDLRKDQMLVNLAVIDRRIEKWVNFLNTLKDERTLLKEYSWDYPYFKDFKKRYDLKIKETTDRLSWLLTDKVRDVANQLLDWQEQLTFLDYQTHLDSLRVLRPAGEVNYKPEEIPHISFSKIYWSSTGEFWMDELESYKVFVESRCNNAGGPAK